MAHMYALSSKTPASSQSSAPIGIHDSYDQFTLDMTTPYNATSLSAAVPTSSDMAPKRDLGDNSVRIYLVHMIFMILAWLILAPLGVLLARYGRTLFSWYPAHRAVQLGTLLAMFIGFFLGVAGLVTSGAKHHFNKTHHQVGLAMLILVFLQVALGFWAHRHLARRGKRYIGFVHAPIGLLLFGLAIWNIQTGFQLWEWEAGNAAVYAVYAWMGFLILLYLAGFAFLPKEIKQSREASDEKMQLNSRDDSEGNSAGSL